MTRPLIRYLAGDPSKAWRPRCLRVGRVVVPLDRAPPRSCSALVGLVLPFLLF